MSQTLHHRGRLAGLSRSREAHDPELLDARRDLAASRLEDCIRRTVESAPPLSSEQRQRLAALLSGGGQLVG